MTPRRVQVPLFELAANPTVHIPDVKGRRFMDETCPVCGMRVPNLIVHCQTVGDDSHGVLEVMAS